MDFTLTQYTRLLTSLLQANYSFLCFENYLNQAKNPKPETQNPILRAVILRHDVDLLPQNSLQFAKIQHAQGIRGSYYFRFVPESYNESIILQIASLGHEIGYHYETMDTQRGDVDKAYDEFCHNLETFRKLVPITTICMHGSPRSPYDNKDIWKKYSYRDLGIIGEPYFDVDFNKLAYYTDTARMWDGQKYSVRDKPDILPSVASAKVGTNSSANNSSTETSAKLNPSLSLTNTHYYSPFPTFHSTPQLIHALQTSSFPTQSMLTFHPQRWTNNPLPWLKEYVFQTGKNWLKYWFFVKR